MQTLFADLRIPHETDVALGPLTWYGVGGPAKILAHPSSVQQLSALLARCYEAHLPAYVLGSGANLLVADAGVPGIVIRLDDPAFRQVSQEHNVMTVGAGYDLARLVLHAAKSGFAGLECLAGIPASVGGAIRMNAGGAYGDIGRCVRRVEVMDASGQVYYRERDDLSFTYRKTNIVAKCIVSAEFELAEDDPQSLIARSSAFSCSRNQRSRWRTAPRALPLRIPRARRVLRRTPPRVAAGMSAPACPPAGSLIASV